MIIKIIDWENKSIKEIETDSIKYEEDGILYTVQFSGQIISVVKLPYNQFLGLKEDR